MRKVIAKRAVVPGPRFCTGSFEPALSPGKCSPFSGLAAGQGDAGTGYKKWRYGGDFGYCFDQLFTDAQAANDTKFAPPEYPTIAIWNNRIQSGPGIADIVHCQEPITQSRNFLHAHVQQVSERQESTSE